MRTVSDRPLLPSIQRQKGGYGRFGVAALALAMGLVWPSARASTATVFACEPEWAALVRVLLPRARLHVATHAGQDPHHIEARPGLIAQLRGADLAVCTGAALESGWLPMLQRKAANPKVQDGELGMFYAADHASLIDPQPATLNPFAGDVHPEGNPHLHTDPRRVREVAESLAQRMEKIWPSHAGEIAERHRAWDTDWQRKITRWSQQTRMLKGRTVVAQHTTFGYLWHWLGIEMVADLEPKPGTPPTPGHLDQLVRSLRGLQPMALVVASYQDKRPAQWLARQLGPSIPVRTLPATVTDPDRPDALTHWMDSLLNTLAGCQGTEGPPCPTAP